MDIKEYILGDNIISYLINDNDNVSLLLYPTDMKKELKNSWEKEPSPWSATADYMNSWQMGSLAYFYVENEQMETPGFTMKSQILATKLTLKEQYLQENGETTSIVTVLESKEGYEIQHCITYYEGRKGLECETTFVNRTGTDIILQMLSSVALDNLSPFQNTDAPGAYYFHRFYGGWSLEGKRVCDSIEDLALEKTWGGSKSSSERFGSIGSYPVERYFPMAVFEDRENSMFWAIQLVHNATWQMELSRFGDTLSLSGGLGDFDYCGWKKIVKNGESFSAPKAYISAVKGDIYDACQAVTDMHKNAWEAYGEEGLPVAFNEYCSSWGEPTQEKMLRYSEALKDFDVKYLVIDAGWAKQGCEQNSNGEWNPDKNIFPDMKKMNEEIRKNGLVPGIWFEMEVTTDGSKMFLSEYDDMHLKRHGRVIKVSDFRSYWDFRREDVREYLREKVIYFLRDNGFGYIKVDYNANIGIGVDGGDSGSEALREHLAAVREFFIEMKREIPELIIENCASGGHRLEPSMIGVSGVSSFSDAHEAIEIPYIAANLHNLMLPAQSLIWVVIHDDEPMERTIYSLAAGFLGRICLSGQIDSLRAEQIELIKEAIAYYKKLENVIKYGETKIYGNRGKNTRYPTGTQVVVRRVEDEAMVVCHAFDEPADDFVIDFPGNYEITESFYGTGIALQDGKLIVQKMKARTAQSVIISKSRK